MMMPQLCEAYIRGRRGRSIEALNESYWLRRRAAADRRGRSRHCWLRVRGQ